MYTCVKEKGAFTLTLEYIYTHSRSITITWPNVEDFMTSTSLTLEPVRIINTTHAEYYTLELGLGLFVFTYVLRVRTRLKIRTCMCIVCSVCMVCILMICIIYVRRCCLAKVAQQVNSATPVAQELLVANVLAGIKWLARVCPYVCPFMCLFLCVCLCLWSIYRTQRRVEWAAAAPTIWWCSRTARHTNSPKNMQIAPEGIDPICGGSDFRQLLVQSQV